MYELNKRTGVRKVQRISEKGVPEKCFSCIHFSFSQLSKVNIDDCMLCELYPRNKLKSTPIVEEEQNNPPTTQELERVKGLLDWMKLNTKILSTPIEEGEEKNYVVISAYDLKREIKQRWPEMKGKA